MCMIIGEAGRRGISRRRFLKGAGTLAAAPLLVGAAPRLTPSLFEPVAAAEHAGRSHTRVVLLGTAGGPVWYPGTKRVGISSALAVGEKFYLIDLGNGSTHRMSEAFNHGTFIKTSGGMVERGTPDFLDNLNALFFTHLHSDHTVEYPSLLNFGFTSGLKPSRPVPVFGPGDRGELPPIFPPGRSASVINPSDPTPGTAGMTKYLFYAFAQTMNYFMRGTGAGDFRAMFDVKDIKLPAIPGFIDPNRTPSPPMKPFTFYHDNYVAVQATLVNHGQVFPAFAYRFDTNDGSVVFSGDTGPNENLIRMAHGADILVHEVIDPIWIHNLFPPPHTAAEEAMLHHLETAHTTIQQVGEVAKAAEVKTLVLSHIAPGNAPMKDLLQAGKNFPGRLIVGEDLMRIGVGQNAQAAHTA